MRLDPSSGTVVEFVPDSSKALGGGGYFYRNRLDIVNLRSSQPTAKETAAR
jgi:hypothetical protein